MDFLSCYSSSVQFDVSTEELGDSHEEFSSISLSSSGHEFCVTETATAPRMDFHRECPDIRARTQHSPRQSREEGFLRERTG